MVKLLIFITSICILNFSLLAQNPVLKGKVTGYGSEPGRINMKGVNIRVDGSYDNCVKTDKNGNFELKLSKGQHAIEFKKKNYRSVSQTFDFNENICYEVEVFLIPDIANYGKKQSTCRLVSSVAINEQIAELKNDSITKPKDTHRKGFWFKPSDGNWVLVDESFRNENSNSTSVDQAQKNQYTIFESKRLALVIGNADYEKAGRLSNPLSDAKSLESALTELGFTVLLHENCTQKNMKIAIDEFGEKLKNYDVGLFFYAGHGVQVDGYNYLVPIDANLKSQKQVEYDCVRADRVLAGMETAKNKTNIIILDACRDNPFERSWIRSPRGKGLAFMNAPSGSLIAYATSPGNTASDGSGNNGLYTSALLQHIKTSDITILQMFQEVRKTVKQKSDGGQIPWESTSLEGDFYFVK